MGASVNTLTLPSSRAVPRWEGRLLAFSLLLLAGSGFAAARIEVGSLLVHPFLVPLALLIPSALSRWNRLPSYVLGAMSTFLVVYAVAALRDRGGLSETVKLATWCVTIVVCAVTPRRREGHRRALLGLVVAATLLSLHGLTGLDDAGPEGINPMEEVANKNSFSLYVLPAMLLGAHLGLDPSTSKRMRITLAVCLLIMVVAIFSTGNRSGYLGVVLIGFMLLVRRGNIVRSVALLSLVSVGGYVFMTQFGDTRVLERRLAQTRDGYESDDLREGLFRESMKIGMESPLVGIGTYELQTELARRLRTRSPRIDPHNTIGLLFGGGGLLLLLTFGYFLYALFRLARQLAAEERPGAHPVTPAALLRMMLVLFLIRGFFSREILYSPAFAAGIGLCIASCLLARSET